MEAAWDAARRRSCSRETTEMRRFEEERKKTDASTRDRAGRCSLYFSPFLTSSASRAAIEPGAGRPPPAVASGAAGAAGAKRSP